MIVSLVVLLLLASTNQSVSAYNSPGCSGWPTKTEWDSELRAQLSDPYHLHGPFGRSAADYSKECILPNQSLPINLAGGKGLCMSSHACANERCLLSEPPNIPAYTVEAVSIADIQAAIQFANTYDIAVSVKSSGHSGQGQSMQADSLLIWLRHFPLTNKITDDFVDSCGNHHSTTISVAAGENIGNVLDGVKQDYNIVIGICPTVCLSGGWIQGGGLSLLSRQYGYGVDQVASFEVVLANATVVTADACTNSDLFWALRGGGGGNFGIVTSLEFKLYSPTKVTVLKFTIQERSVRRKWVSFMVREFPHADTRWSGGFVEPDGPSTLCFLGSREEATLSDLMVAMDFWYNDLILSSENPGFDRPSRLLEEYQSLYDSRGGAEVFENPDTEVPASSVPPFIGRSFSRLIPLNVALEQTDELIDLIDSLDQLGLIFNMYYLGGLASEVARTETAVHPGLRNAFFSIEPFNDLANKRILEFAGDKVAEWGVSYNHHDVLENDYENVLWGDQYPRLQEIKAKYDPDHRFNVYHGVNYKFRKETHNCGHEATNIFYLFFYFLSYLIRFVQHILELLRLVG